MQNPDPSRLASVPLFSGLSDDERAELATWLDTEDHAAGMQLARQGAADYAFFVLDEGRARVEQDGKAVGTLGAGDVFGEIAFFDHGRRTADVVAETDVRVLVMFGTRFREMQTTLPAVAGQLEALVRERTDAG